VGVIGRFATAPLVVEGRLRVYATIRQVWADEPVDDRQRNTPYWSYRRWPAQLTGVVSSGHTVVSRWTDGRLVALDARTGRVAWQADGPPPEEGHTGRRTGAATVWTPPGLHTASTPDGRPVVVAVGAAEARAVELDTGRELWRVALDGDCRTDLGTSTAGRLALLDRCADRPAVEFRDVATGAVTERWSPPGAGAELVVVRWLCHRPLTVPRVWTGAARPVAGTAWAGLVARRRHPGGRTGPRRLRHGARRGTRRPGRGRGGHRPLGAYRRRCGADDLGPATRARRQSGRVHLLTEANDLVT
jgi:hypothetical protein